MLLYLGLVVPDREACFIFCCFGGIENFFGTYFRDVFFVGEEVGALDLEDGRDFLLPIVACRSHRVSALMEFIQDHVELNLVVDTFESGKGLLYLILG